MNFSHSLFYKLDEGSGSTVSDSLGHGPVGTIAGTLTNVWANAGNLTISNAAGSGGDNSIKLQNAYIDQMCDLSTLEGKSLVMMFWYRQPVLISSGDPFLMSYGRMQPNGQVVGFGLGAIGMTFQHGSADGASIVSRGAGCIEPLTANENNEWYAYSVQIDVFDGRVVVSGCMDGRPQRGARIFNIEADGLPTVDTSGTGLRLLAAASGVSGSAGYLWGQTQIKNFFIGRTNGEQRHNIPKWATRFYNNDHDWMTE